MMLCKATRHSSNVSRVPRSIQERCSQVLQTSIMRLSNITNIHQPLNSLLPTLMRRRTPVMVMGKPANKLMLTPTAIRNPRNTVNQSVLTPIQTRTPRCGNTTTMDMNEDVGDVVVSRPRSLALPVVCEAYHDV